MPKRILSLLSALADAFVQTKGERPHPSHTRHLLPSEKAKRAPPRGRQDYGGGVCENHFFLNNCGFFDKNDTLDTIFTVDKNKMVKPEIDLNALKNE